MKSEQIKAEIESLEARIDPLQRALAPLQRSYREALSREFIVANSITRDQIELSAGEGKPWFGHLRAFVIWLGQQNPRKPWAEWNGYLYSTQKLLCDDWRETPGRFEDVN